MCKYNANVAAMFEKPDLVQAWCLAALVMAHPISNIRNTLTSCQITELETPWPFHPFGQNLIHSL